MQAERLRRSACIADFEAKMDEEGASAPSSSIFAVDPILSSEQEKAIEEKGFALFRRLPIA